MIKHFHPFHFDEANNTGVNKEVELWKFFSIFSNESAKSSKFEWQFKSLLYGLRIYFASVVFFKTFPNYLLKNFDSVVVNNFVSQEIMNFSYTLIKPPDGNWGSIQPDGSWNGMVNLLAKQDIDIATTDFTVTHERSAVMTFATPITQIYHALFIKNPAEKFNYMAYVEPMHWLSWVGIFVLILTLPPLLFMTTR